MNIQIESLTHIYPGKTPRTALEDLSVHIPAGQFVAIVGPSGCGKSTLLRLIADLLRPTRGMISLDGLSPAGAAARRRIAWMAQAPALLPWLTARANVALAGHFLPNEGPRIPPDEALERVGLSESANAYPFMLSGGMQQRLALARTISLPADLWLMDEPFAALDELNRERLTGELIDLWQPYRSTVLWVTHNLTEALRLADRVLALSPGPARLAADMGIDLPRPRDETAPEFIHLLKRLRGTLDNG